MRPAGFRAELQDVPCARKLKDQTSICLSLSTENSLSARVLQTLETLMLLFPTEGKRQYIFIPISVSVFICLLAKYLMNHLLDFTQTLRKWSLNAQIHLINICRQPN